MTPQQKILYVANELGITDMKNMQGTTRGLYHVVDSTTQPLPNYNFFGPALANATFIDQTNVPSNGMLQVNEALLVEKIQFNEVVNGQGWDGGIFDDFVVNFYIANQRVLKDIRIRFYQNFASGPAFMFEGTTELYLEGAGILIPPQVEFRVEATRISEVTSTGVTGITTKVACTLYGTGVLLNLNTSL